ncbi:MAG: xanthine dehydrogenase family protein subunit M [Thermodesulfobacteriota bacterium]|jgi:carbon-monoxide dehydrogenase medium subunit
MKNFEYLEPRTVAEAVFLLTEYGDEAKVLAGGTDLIVQMKLKKQTPKYLVNIKKISDLDYIRYDNKFLRIGALTTFSALAQSTMIQENFSILMDSVRAVGPLQIRNRGTIAGNLCHASPSADTAPSLLALDARVKTVSLGEERMIPIKEFFKGPFATCLKAGELLTEILVPSIPSNTGGTYLWLPKKTAVDETLVGVATLVTLDVNGVCDDVKIGLGSVAPTPIRAEKAEKLLHKKKIEDGLLSEVGEMAVDEAAPRSRAEYRAKMVSVLVVRALKESVRKVVSHMRN